LPCEESRQKKWCSQNWPAVQFKPSDVSQKFLHIRCLAFRVKIVQHQAANNCLLSIISLLLCSQCQHLAIRHSQMELMSNRDPWLWLENSRQQFSINVKEEICAARSVVKDKAINRMHAQLHCLCPPDLK